MATHHGNEGSAAIGANAIAEVTAWSYSETDPAIVEDTAIGDTTTTRLASGRVDGSGSVTCHFDETDTNGQESMTAGATVTLNLYTEGTASGDAYYTGDVIIETVETSVDMSSVSARTFNFVGPLTYTTVT
jgi:hypothetical protein